MKNTHLTCDIHKSSNLSGWHWFKKYIYIYIYIYINHVCVCDPLCEIQAKSRITHLFLFQNILQHQIFQLQSSFKKAGRQEMSVMCTEPVGCPYNSLHAWVVIEFREISHGVRLLYLPLSGRLFSHSCEWIKLTGGSTEPCGAQAVTTSTASALPTGAALYPLTGKTASLRRYALSCH